MRESKLKDTEGKTGLKPRDKTVRDNTMAPGDSFPLRARMGFPRV